MATETSITPARLLEMASQADRIGGCRCSPFLTPPEAEYAEAAARKARVDIALFGGYTDAERRIARFSAIDAKPVDFPITILRLTWPHEVAPLHRDLLGSVMGLGISRAVVGDIALMDDCAYLFVDTTIANVVENGLTQAGRTHITVARVRECPELAVSVGEEVRCTVSSLRLDALLADGFHLSRGKAAECIEAGQVKLRYQPCLRPDARVNEGDMISARGFGRLQLLSVGTPTRKDRLPIRMTRFGNLK